MDIRSLSPRRVDLSSTRRSCERRLEQVLCVKREDIFPDGAWHGFVSDRLDERQAVIREHHFFMARAKVEDDPSYQQIIRTSCFATATAFFLTHRLRASSESGCAKQYSLGLGGHINPGDLEGGDPNPGRVETRVEEEVIYDGSFEAKLIACSTMSLARIEVHLGVVFLVDGSSPNIAIRETDKLAGELLTLEEMRIYYLGMESWSQMVYDRLARGELPR